ncbi:MAG: hypothetical protein R2793_06470 [Flavobacteriaceae bacterium]
MSNKKAFRTALIFFAIGSVLFLIQWAAGPQLPLYMLGFLFVVFAVVYNTLLFFILLIRLIKHNELETFFSMLILLANLPIAMGYFYILIHYL